MSNPYAPDESQADLWIEQSINAGTYIAAVAYGMHAIVFMKSIYHLLGRRGLRRSWLPVLFVIILFGLGSINIACNIRFNEYTWIDDRNYPGGPFAYIMEQEQNPLNTAANCASIVATFLADGLLLYRCFVIWNNKWLLLVIPFLMYLASVVLSVFFVIQAAQPDSSLWAQGTFDFSVPYWALSMSLNIILTLMLVSRLLRMRREIIGTLGNEHGKTYSYIAAMLVECAIPYGLVSFIFIVLYAVQNTGENLFIPLLCQVQCVTPMLIVLRVAQGRAWSRSTFANASTVSEIEFVERKDLSGIDTVPPTTDTDISSMTFGRSNPDLLHKDSAASLTQETV